MKRKKRRGLALMLAFVLAGAACMMPDIKVSAASAAGTDNTQNQNLEVVNKTAESITLRTQENYEYAIETVTNQVRAWKWADASQYDKTNKTVTFAGLNADQTYQFASRIAGTTEVLGQSAVKTNALESTPAAPTPDTAGTVPDTSETDKNTPETNIPETNVPETNVPDTTVGSQDTEGDSAGTAADTQTTDGDDQNVPDQSPADPGSNTDKPNENQNNPQNDNQNNTQQPADDSKDTVDDVSGGKGTEQDSKDTPDKTGTTNTTEKEKLPKPDAPVISNVTDQKITLELPKSAEEKYHYEYSMDGKAFQTSPEFDQLKPETEYSFCIRIAAGTYDGTAYQDPSENSAFTDPVKTKKSAPEKPKYAPELAKKTDTSVTLKAAADEKNPKALEYGLRTSDTEIQWNQSGVFENLTPGTAYEFVVRYGVDEKVQMTGEASDALKVTTLEKAAAAPEAPTLSKRSETSITLKAADGQQYGLVKADGSVNWQDSSTFDGLKPNTAYQFAARMKYDPDKAMESIRSETAGFKTVISFEGSKITGIKAGGSYDEGTKLTAVAVGTGMDNTAPAAGDTRWIPKSWSWDGEKWKNWDNAPYSITATYSQPGSYNLRVSYQLQEYTKDGWQAAQETKTANVKFKVIEKKVFFTIQAEAGANGKITPSGKVEVQKGKDYEFIFTPNKGYRTAKVTVDGKAVTFKNNRYKFTNVQEAHKISVTFEKDKKTPKTGDMSQPAVFLGLLLISGMLILGLAYRKRRS